MARTPKVVEDRHEQIIDAALRVFAEKGFARATNRDIAREAGITTGLIYYYFKSKEDLLKAALEERSPVHLMTQVSPAMLEQPPAVLLPLVITSVLSLVESEQFVTIVRVLLSEMLHGDTEIAPILLGFFQLQLDFLSNYLKIQLARGGVRADLDADATAQIIASSIVGMVVRRQIIRDPSVLQFTQEKLVEAVLNTFLQGILPHSFL